MEKRWGEGRKEQKGKKRKEKRRKEGNCSIKEGKFLYFVCLFDIGPYDRKKSFSSKDFNFCPKKRNFKK